ncbi:MAG: homocysteine S-methyltransferase [bacterium]|nr:homocysteine S-methyltransferase [bacterium]
MTRYREQLPQLDGQLFLTDGGLETTLIFHDGIDLPHFAAFDLLTSDEGSQRIENYYAIYAELARKSGLGLVLETPTWRASQDWGALMGHDATALRELNQASVRQLEALRDRFETSETPIVISGCLGPRGDGYDPSHRLSVDQAAAYHRAQIEAFADSAADLVSAITMTHVEEAIGVVLSARASSMPAVIAFTVETDGRLPTGQPVGDAMEAVDRATDAHPAYYAINCAHPTHFTEVLLAAGSAPWIERLRAIRANASRKSHAELDEATELDDGNPAEFGEQCQALRRRLPQINVWGGCCGTDHRHIEAIAEAARA